MAVKFAINGFGRIGRMVFRRLFEKNMLDGQVELVAINDLVPAKNLAYLLKYDSVHDVWEKDVKALSDELIKVDGMELKTLSMKVGPEDLPWEELGVDVVLESTGLFAKKKKYEGHLKAGAGKVLISAPSDPETKTIVMGVNDDSYEGDKVVSNASCTTNCLAPLVHVLLKEGIGLEEGIMSTIHSYTVSQGILDGPSKKDFRRGRAAAENIVPTTTGAAKAVGLVIPEVQGKLTGMAYRVPTPDGSIVDLTVRTEKETSLDEINGLMKKASETYLNGYLEYTEEPLVSRDIVHNSHSCIYDANGGIELNSKFFKLLGWYDNEWGYSCRIVDLLEKMIS
ncbi:type I glyceraldehyde-3-phosphate dehydrogenase [Candidatus Dojkabacteria bacterium]|nr:type I glyceraldehyde-3-phosphate dehydrogenase [Candidatus Dojkabacteria bacterium]